MSTVTGSWQVWAVMSAIFAAITAILAKIGVANIDSNYATFIRTVVVLVFLGLIVAAMGQFQPLSAIPRKSLIFLVFSGVATGLSWLCYFRALQLGTASQVAPIDKLSLVLVAIMGVAFLGEKLSVRNWVGVVCMAAGAILVAWKR